MDSAGLPVGVTIATTQLGAAETSAVAAALPTSMEEDRGAGRAIQTEHVSEGTKINKIGVGQQVHSTAGSSVRAPVVPVSSLEPATFGKLETSGGVCATGDNHKGAEASQPAADVAAVRSDADVAGVMAAAAAVISSPKIKEEVTTALGVGDALLERINRESNFHQKAGGPASPELVVSFGSPNRFRGAASTNPGSPSPAGNSQSPSLSASFSASFNASQHGRSQFNSMIPPPPPPPDNESKEDRLSRQQRELSDALNVLHSETLHMDSDCKVFAAPVDPKLVPGYLDVISRPMDLSTIGRKLKKDEYTTIWPYLDDMHLMLDNCMLFNKQGTFFHKHAQKILKFWQPRAEHIATVTLSSHNYCCGKRRVLSGVSYRCRGGTCFVKYGCVYWHFDPQDDEDPIIYCQSHYQRLPNEVKIPRFGNGTGDEIVFDKSKLTRRRHTSPLTMEKLLTCVTCGAVHHEICKLHLLAVDPVYRCSRCLKTEKLPEPKIQMAVDLPTCHLSDTIEQELRYRVPLIGKCVCVRVVDAEEDMCEIKKLLKSRNPELAPGFPYTRKMILFFLNIRGRPVCFFGMIVHEYGSDCPEPNKNRAYLALLDSVKLPKAMLPSAYRTTIYHSSIRGYLRSAGDRGFKYCHIYTCPPRKGQNYIFPHKPEDQKEIDVSRLRKWYADIMTSSVTCNPPAIVGFRNIGEVYKQPTLTSLPYFDGDNWPDMIEDILKVDQTQEEADKLNEELRKQVEDMQNRIWKAAKDGNVDPEHKKPSIVAGYYAGVPPPKKRRKVETRRPPKPKMTADMRLYRVMAERKRDFLVVELIRREGAPERVVDPDLKLELAKIRGDQSIAGFMKHQKLEFSSLRHAQFSTMLLIHALTANCTPPDRFPSERPSADDG